MTAIRIGAGIRRELPQLVTELGAHRRVAVLLDANVDAGDLDWIPPHWLRLDLPGGESCKTFQALERVVRQLAQWELDRDAVLVAVGGGAIGDLGGLSASLYLRGIRVVQVPTTVLAMLDSSVGGKTAINIPEGKNLVGSFCPPDLMLADLDFARTLPSSHLRSGLGEAIKMGMGFRSDLFELLEDQAEAILAGDPEPLTQVVTAAVEAKMDCVAADPKETTGQRRCLNLGHTLAHALEARSDYTMLHGLAVGQGLHYALDLAVTLGTISTPDAQRSHALLDRYGMPAETVPGHDALLPYFLRDKKMSDGKLWMVLPTGIGSCDSMALDPRSMRPAG